MVGEPCLHGGNIRADLIGQLPALHLLRQYIGAVRLDKLLDRRYPRRFPLALAFLLLPLGFEPVVLGTFVPQLKFLKDLGQRRFERRLLIV